MPATHDSETVRQHFATYEPLRVRQSIHDRYTVPRIDYIRWVLNTSLHWQGDEHILDLGCGAGTYEPTIRATWPDVTYRGIDASAGMLEHHPAKDKIIRGDALRLPYTENTFDVVMANHVLYHLDHIDDTIREIRRVLKPDGVLIAATNSWHNMPELQVLLRRAILLLTQTNVSRIYAPSLASDRFALENGALQLARHFYAVMRHDLPGKLVFDAPDPLMRYLETTRLLRQPHLPSDIHWDDLMTIMRQQITHMVQHLGELVITKLTGVLVATDRGGFIQDFVNIHETLHG